MAGTCATTWASCVLIICACGVPAENWVRRDGKNYNDVDVAIAMDHLILAAADLGLGIAVRYADPRETPGRIVADAPPYGSGNFGQVGLRAEWTLDGRDVPARPTRGARLRTPIRQAVDFAKKAGCSTLAPSSGYSSTSTLRMQSLARRAQNARSVSGAQASPAPPSGGGAAAPASAPALHSNGFADVAASNLVHVAAHVCNQDG